jgi:glyoxylase-like metal-dependent hydrolase (beta-lactamase superfamily II)
MCFVHLADGASVRRTKRLTYTIREWVEAPGVRYEPVDGELELLPGLRLVPAPGHTRGLRVVVVETGGRPVAVGGDVGRLPRRARRAAQRGPVAGARARVRARLARARARALAGPLASCSSHSRVGWNSNKPRHLCDAPLQGSRRSRVLGLDTREVEAVRPSSRLVLSSRGRRRPARGPV